MSTELNMILYEEMIESMQEGIIIINAKGTVIRMNDAAMRLLGVDCSAVGVPYALLMVEDTNNDDFHEIVLGAIYERKKISGQIVKLAGDEIWVSVTASYLNNEAGKAVVIVMEDLTGISELRDARIALNKIRKLNEELEGAKNEAIEANNAKSRFISNVSHEIRTPINAVLGMNEMILRETQEEQILQYANNIQNAGKTLHFLINDILDMSKIEAGRMELTESEYELNRLLQELWGLIYLRAQEKGLAIYFIIDKNTPLHLYGDDIRIKQILTNILTNAVKYTPKGEVKLTLEYQKKDDDMIELIVAVSDTGIGIREEDKAAVFESFRRVDAHKNKSIEGTGLGMNITMSLLDLMNGSLQMESVYQQGSTFTVRIPQKVCGIETIGEFDVQKLNINGRSEKENRTTIYDLQLKATNYADAVKEILKRTAYEKLRNSGIIQNITVDDTPDKRNSMGQENDEASDKTIEMVAESDYEFVVKIGKRNNFEFFTECGNVIFRKAKSDTKILMEISPTMPLRNFDISYDITGIVEKVVVRGMDVSKAKVIKAEKKFSNSISQGNKAKAVIKGSQKVYIDSTLSSKEEAETRVESLMENMSYRYGTLRCELIGIPELQPGHFIRMFGLGTGPDNKFYLNRVKHVYDDEGRYHVELEGIGDSAGNEDVFGDIGSISSLF